MGDAERQDSPSFYLEVCGPEQDDRRHEVGPNGLLLGRSESCDLVFESREVSRRHAYFYRAGGHCYVKDLGSKNGTLVNGDPVREERLADGQAIDVGPAQLILRIEGGGGNGSRSRAGAAREARAESRHAGLTSEGGRRHPLAMGALIFGAMTYLHWAFGVGGIVLALVSLWEMRSARPGLGSGRALALGGLVLGLCGGLLNGWFAEVAPYSYQGSVETARLACRENLMRIRDALRDYGGAHGGAYPARLDMLVDGGLLDVAALACPGRRLSGRGPASYLYFRPAGPYRRRPDAAVVCDADLLYHQGRGGWILRAGGNVEWLAGEYFTRVIAQAGRSRSGARTSSGRRDSQ